MTRLWTLAMGLGFLAMALRDRRPLVRVPLGLVGVRLLSRSFLPEETADDRVWGHRWPHPHEDDVAAAPGSELPAWW